MNMTEGSIPRLLITFSIPLLLGNIFQQMYNIVDTWVVGNYVSNEAFSAVGTVGPIINVMISLYIGFSSGAGVVIAQYFGACKEKEAQKAVHTSFVTTLIFTVVMTTVGITMRRAFLRLMNMPEEVMPEASLYLMIFFAGIGGLFFYNIGAATLQAIGDSRRPFYFLSAATVLNIIGDLVFVLVFHRGVEGVAFATILGMAVSAICMIVTLVRTKTCVRLRLSMMRIDGRIFRQIIRVGIPAALQMAIVSFSNIIVQGYINQFGPDVMSGWTAYIKIDALMFLPIQSLAVAITTFVGQNIGGGEIERARQGVRTAIWLTILITIVLSIPVIAFAPWLVAFFNDKAEVVYYGTLLLRWMTPFYFIAGSANIHSAGLRGAGNSRTPMIINVLCYVCFRQVYLYVVSHYVANAIIPLAMGYPAGWLVCSVLTYLYFRKADLGATSVMKSADISGEGE